MVLIQIPRIASDQGIMSVQSSSLIVSLTTLGGFIGGIVFGQIYNKLKGYTLPTFTFLYVLGLLGLLFATNGIILALGSLLAGFCTACNICAVNMITSIVPQDAQSGANTILLIGQNIGSFSAPYGIALAQAILGTTSTTPVLFYAVILTAITVIGYVIIRTTKITF